MDFLELRIAIITKIHTDIVFVPLQHTFCMERCVRIHMKKH